VSCDSDSVSHQSTDSPVSAQLWQVSALTPAPYFKGDKFIMASKETPKPWVINRLLPTLQWALVGRYRSRSDAEGYLQLCRERVPNARFEVVFDMSETKASSGDGH
jgi:hypothetical protein